MNKQELAAKIWGSANELRGNIELGTYKDYMLSLLFYKFLSDKEIAYLLSQGWTEGDLKDINEDDTDTVTDCQRNIGYFIAYEHLFPTWIKMEHDFNVKNVTDALSAFDRLIGDSHKKVFSKIFETLQSNISNLGATAVEQTKALRKLIEVINEIPADKTQDYDVLGFIYEYLIGNFAASAGKKAGSSRNLTKGWTISAVQGMPARLTLTLMASLSCVCRNFRGSERMRARRREWLEGMQSLFGAGYTCTCTSTHLGGRNRMPPLTGIFLS